VISLGGFQIEVLFDHQGDPGGNEQAPSRDPRRR
jgi:hypothetical protein